MASISLNFQSLEELVSNLKDLDNSTINYLAALLKKLQKERGILENGLQLDEASFWKFISLIDDSRTEENKAISPLVAALANSPQAIIFQFAESLAFHLHQLDGPTFFDAMGQNNKLGASADTFLYARCSVVAKGEIFYKKVLEQPKYMPAAGGMESLLYVAEEAFELKMSKPYEYIPTINFESFFNRALWGSQAITL
ncbi:MAG: DUF4240 domain-containing protein [Bacteroidota bacterium]